MRKRTKKGKRRLAGMFYTNEAISNHWMRLFFFFLSLVLTIVNQPVTDRGFLAKFL